jgi:hypothetical protein
MDLLMREVARPQKITFGEMRASGIRAANAISRGDSVAILEKQKAAPKGGFSI